METYLVKLPVSLKIYSAKFKVLNHKSPMERDRYENLEHSDKQCNVCHVLGGGISFFVSVQYFK